ncbi:MetQ/NlpA family ABC transporter substrate-binding protein [Actinomycetospora aeridis]|uniref:MetQ/NlpA family ABC transporter substrate-binding protein n=1 Tax=Actinomycetospora aeridis TaxID=3129231 RepID=A0ABU8NC43_9PSEU
MPRALRPVLVLVAALLLAVGCSAPGESSGGDGQTVRIGVADAAENYWRVYADRARAEGIIVEFVNFTDYNQPNPALAQGQLELNEFQHLQYLANYNAKNNGDLVPIGATAVYPLPLYSTKYPTVDAIPAGGRIAIPNDPTNQARALLVLQAARLITLRGGGSANSTPAEIDQATSRVTVVPIDAAQTAANLAGVDGAVVNNNYATAANLREDQVLFKDDPNSPSSRPYINAFVARGADRDNPTYQRLAALYHDPQVIEAARADLGASGVFVTTPAAELQAAEQQLRQAATQAGG